MAAMSTVENDERRDCSGMVVGLKLGCQQHLRRALRAASIRGRLPSPIIDYDIHHIVAAANLKHIYDRRICWSSSVCIRLSEYNFMCCNTAIKRNDVSLNDDLIEGHLKIISVLVLSQSFIMISELESS